MGAWLRLAEEVAPLFGSMPGFDAILDRKIAQKQAYRACVDAKLPTFVGGLLIGGSKRTHWIRWLAVSFGYRRLGIGKMLLGASLDRIPDESLIYVDTFIDGHSGAGAADRLYRSCGFEPVGVTIIDGDRRQRYARRPVELIE